MGSATTTDNREPESQADVIAHAMVEGIDTLLLLEQASQPDLPAQDLPAMAAARILSIYIPEGAPESPADLAKQLEAVCDGLSQAAFRALHGVRVRAALEGVVFGKPHEEAAYLRNLLRRIADELVVHLRQAKLEVAQ